MLRGDFDSNAIPMMLEASKNSDFIVLDLVDDRFSTVKVSTEQYFTHSVTAKLEKFTSLFPGKELITPGSTNHSEMWLQAAEKVRKAFDPIIGKTVVFGGPWAATDNNGKPLPGHLGKSVEEWNQVNSWFLESLKSLDFTILNLPEHLAIADPQHRWGRSPFHYIPQAYDYWAKELLTKQIF